MILNKSFVIQPKDSLKRYVMVFEYADSGSLRNYLSDPSVELDWPARCKLGIDIIDGLRYLHSILFFRSILFLRSIDLQVDPFTPWDFPSKLQSFIHLQKVDIFPNKWGFSSSSKCK